MRKANISILNKENIKSRKLVDLIPELYKLNGVIENNDWHNKETAFEHTLSVLDNLEKIIRGLKKENKKILNEIFDKKV